MSLRWGARRLGLLTLASLPPVPRCEQSTEWQRPECEQGGEAENARKGQGSIKAPRGSRRGKGQGAA
eukprot:1267986-Prymnesium_polylepis.2